MTNQEFFSKHKIGIDTIVNIMKKHKEKDLTKFLKQKCYYVPKFKAGDIVAVYNHDDNKTESLIVITAVFENAMEYYYKFFDNEHIMPLQRKIFSSKLNIVSIYEIDESSYKIGTSEWN